MFKAFGDFLISEWLWNILFALPQLIWCFFIMLILLGFFMHEKWLKSFMVSLGAQLFSLSIFTGFVIGILMYLFSWEYNDTMPDTTIHISSWWASNWLALIHASLQVIYFFLIKKLLKYYWVWYAVVAILSNVLAGWFTILCIRIFIGI